MIDKNYYELVALAKNRDWRRFSDLLDKFPEAALFRDEMCVGILIELSGISGAALWIKLVISLGANPDIRTEEGETAIGRSIAMDSALNPTIENTEMLLKLGANPDGITTSGNTPLVFALEANKLNHARKLIEFGADVNKLTNDVFPISAADIMQSKGYSL
jgi:ankyrin repeat protein